MPKPDDQTKAADQAVPDNVVVLDEPIKRGDTTITQLELRKPMSGELRGVSLSDLLTRIELLSLRYRRTSPRIIGTA